MLLHETFRTGLIFPRQSKWVQTVVCYDQNLQKHKYLSTISIFLQKTFRTGLIFPSWSKWVQTVVCYDQNLQNINISTWNNRAHFSELVEMSPNSGMLCSKLSMISIFLHKTFRTRLNFPNRSKWVQRIVCYDQNLQKHKYLSTISLLLHETFRTGLVFPSQSKWVQTVVCYDQNLQKHKYLSTISIFLHETFRTGLILPRQWKWVQTVVCYDQNLQKHKYLSMISIFLHKPSEQGSFSELVEMSPNSGMLWSKLTKT